MKKLIASILMIGMLTMGCASMTPREKGEAIGHIGGMFIGIALAPIGSMDPSMADISNTVFVTWMTSEAGEFIGGEIGQDIDNCSRTDCYLNSENDESETKKENQEVNFKH